MVQLAGKQRALAVLKNIRTARAFCFRPGLPIGQPFSFHPIKSANGFLTLFVFVIEGNLWVELNETQQFFSPEKIGSTSGKRGGIP
jgi:hypothetical protein